MAPLHLSKYSSFKQYFDENMKYMIPINNEQFQQLYNFLKTPVENKILTFTNKFVQTKYCNIIFFYYKKFFCVHDENESWVLKRNSIEVLNEMEHIWEYGLNEYVNFSSVLIKNFDIEEKFPNVKFMLDGKLLYEPAGDYFDFYFFDLEKEALMHYNDHDGTLEQSWFTYDKAFHEVEDITLCLSIVKKIEEINIIKNI